MQKNNLAVEFRSLSKRFGAVQANSDIHLKIERGTIHGVIGENGAGKSTAMKQLYGIYRPDSGEILIHGEKKSWRSPADAIAAGIGMVHQHFMLAGPNTVLDNIILGSEPPPRFPLGRLIPRFLRRIERSEARQRLQAIARQYGLPVNWGAVTETLPVGIQQRVEILKLLYRNANILILDEPTAVLTPQEVTDLFAQLKKLRAEGKTIIIITHKLREVMAITDRISVFRSGQMVGEVETSSTSPQALADLMVGRKVLLKVESPPPPTVGAPVLDLQKVTLREGARDVLSAVSFQVRAGEIVGIAGVEGNGQSELLDLLMRPRDFGSKLSSESKIVVVGQEGKKKNARQIRELGMGVIPEDRHHQGLLLARSVKENFLLGLQHFSRFKKMGFITDRAVHAEALQACDEYDVRPCNRTRDLTVSIGGLSGGNQQKVIIARELSRKPKFLIAAQPTRGVDVGAIEFIHKRLLEIRTAGTGVLLVSSELEEVLSLSDRILVLYRGKIVAEYARGACDERRLGLQMGGGSSA